MAMLNTITHLKVDKSLPRLQSDTQTQGEEEYTIEESA
jgi:hypothetical protein